MNYRSPRILALAKECPKCMSCGAANDGTIVACHSNSQRHGKGMGLKAHDIPAFICSGCHDLLDGRVMTGMTREDKERMFLDACFWSVLWMLQAGKLRVA